MPKDLPLSASIRSMMRDAEESLSRSWRKTAHPTRSFQNLSSLSQTGKPWFSWVYFGFFGKSGENFRESQSPSGYFTIY